MARKTSVKKAITCLVVTLIFFHICQIWYRKNKFGMNKSFSSANENGVLADKTGKGNAKDKHITARDEESREEETLRHATIHKLYINKDTLVSDHTLDNKESGTKGASAQLDDGEQQQSNRNKYSAAEKIVKEIKAAVVETMALRKWNVNQKQDDAAKKKKTNMYDGHDLMEDPPYKFNRNFKNPCWYEQNDDRDGEGELLRCLPYVFVIGVKKCGTSDVFYRLSLHPDFIKPGFKEAQWFARTRFETFKGEVYDGINDYVNMFSRAASKIDRSARSASKRVPYNYKHITGEGSPSNLHLNTHWMHLPGNENVDEPKFVILDYIHHFLPNAKIIITFRDPVERLYSDYYHEYSYLQRNNTPTPYQFHLVVTEGIQLYKDCFQHHSIRSCVYNPELYGKTKIQIQLGIYFIFWEELTRLFPREQILVLQNKDLRDKETTMRKVYKFLDMRPLTGAEMFEVVNATERNTMEYVTGLDKKPMLDITYRTLRDFYRPFNEIMAELTHDETFVYEEDFRKAPKSSKATSLRASYKDNILRVSSKLKSLKEKVNRHL